MNPMDEATFWKLIEESRGSRDNEKASCDILARLLAAQEPEEIADFDRFFRSMEERADRPDLRAAAALATGGDCSEDGFGDFRCWLVSRGRERFEAALRDPAQEAKPRPDESSDCQWETFGYIAMRVYRDRLGIAETSTMADDFRPRPRSSSSLMVRARNLRAKLLAGLAALGRRPDPEARPLKKEESSAKASKTSLAPRRKAVKKRKEEKKRRKRS
jgi:hypothetical protein